MSKRPFKASASSGRVVAAFGGFGSANTTSTSVLSYIQAPLDLETISNPSVIVILKNLQKRDETTKAKALDELQEVVDETPNIEDALLELWIHLFPRLSIDNSRRVRHATQIVNGRVCAGVGKRIARHMPTIIGPWLSALYDSDRAVIKSAQDALTLVFPDSGKVAALRKVYHLAILKYSRNAAIHESVSSLSDERVVTKDDAEATYGRVVSSALALISSLINRLSEEELLNHIEIYQDVLDTKIFDFVVHADSGIRKSTHQLVRSAVIKLNGIISDRLSDISKMYVYKGTPSDQSGSALEYATTLVVLTQNFPTIWTDAYTGRKTAASRLSYLFKHGSHGGGSPYWSQLSQLITSLPTTVVTSKLEDVTDMLSAFRQGLTRREDRLYSLEGWQTYKTLVGTILQAIPSEMQSTIVEQNVAPLLTQYLYPADEAQEWTVQASKASSTVAHLINVPLGGNLLAAHTTAISDRLIESMKMSQPEQAKDYEKSQLNVAAAGERWASLQRELLAIEDTDTSLISAFLAEDARIISEALQLVVSRNGKPYGAAAVVDVLLRDCGLQLLEQNDVDQQIIRFVTESLPSLLFTPSSRHLIPLLTSLRAREDFPTLLKEVLRTIIHSDSSRDEKLQLISDLYAHKVGSQASDIALTLPELQDLISEKSQNNAAVSVTTLSRLISAGVVSPGSRKKFVEQLVTSLQTLETSAKALQDLDYISREHNGLLVACDSDPETSSLHVMPNVLRLIESEDNETARLAQDLSDKLAISNGDTTGQNRFTVIRHALKETNSSSTSIDVLTGYSRKVLADSTSPEDFLTCFPEWQAWRTDIASNIKPPAPTLSICSAFGSAVYSVKFLARTTNVTFDSEGLTSAQRTAILFVRLTESTGLKSILKNDPSTPLLSLFSLSLATLYAAQDSVSVESGYEVEGSAAASILEAVDKVNMQLAELVPTKDIASFDQAMQVITALEDQADSPLTYYLAMTRARVMLAASVVIIDSPRVLTPKTLLSRSADLVFTTCAEISAYAQIPAYHPVLSRLANELVADLTMLDFTTDTASCQTKLMLLNIIFAADDMYATQVAKQRIVFLIKHLLEALSSTRSQVIGEEGLRLLSFVLPSIHDIFGEHWSATLDIILRTWSDLKQQQRQPGHLPTLYHTLRLYSTLRKLCTLEDVNDDLVELLDEKKSVVAADLLALLKSSSGAADTNDQPLALTNELLARQVLSLQPRPSTDVADLLPLFYIPSRPIQEAAFTLTYEQIPKLQEQVSLDAALDNKVARLPDELLSMLLEVPIADNYEDEDFQFAAPTPIQTYLNSWRLLFAYFDGSSHKVKQDYSDHLKDGAYLMKLLGFIFDFLGHVRGKASRIPSNDVTQYQAGLEMNPLGHTRSLLAHLYYLSLLHLPSLVKSYMLQLRSRTMPTIVEEWTAKYVSPAIITATLQAVSEWSEKTVKEDPEYEKMTVKVGHSSKEVNVSYLVDEQTMAIKVILPDAYPLAPALVVSVSRVAVKEDQWQSWLRNCQGVITFSNGSITDGLNAWRRNVVAKLSGQTECAICYSIVSVDKQLPSKKCPTCRNSFHSSCLFKWFKTSNASTCPLCRNSFTFN